MRRPFDRDKAMRDETWVIKEEKQPKPSARLVTWVEDGQTFPYLDM
jgi:hypothetical protein